MLQAIIFDFDGTIMDTERHEYESWQQVYSARQTEMPRSVWQSIIGRGQHDFDPFAYLAERTGQPVDRAAVIEERRALLYAGLAAERPRPGVVELLTYAAAQGLKLGVASSSSRRWVEGHLREQGLRHFFATVKTKDDVRQTKPEPELYLAALADLGVPAAAACAIEDSPTGALAAKRAGLACVVVPGPMTADMTFPEVELRLGTLADLTPAELVARLDLPR